MIQKDTEEWGQFLRNLNWSKQKSNRDVLCLKCWKIMKYEECVKHKMLSPDHIKSILTSKEYASEGKFIAVARAMGKVRYEEGGTKELYENPYKTKDRRGRPPAHLSLFSDDFRRQKESEGYHQGYGGGQETGGQGLLQQAYPRGNGLLSGMGNNGNQQILSTNQNHLYPGSSTGAAIQDQAAGGINHGLFQRNSLIPGFHNGYAPSTSLPFNPFLTSAFGASDYLKAHQFNLNPTPGHHVLDQSRIINLATQQTQMSGFHPNASNSYFSASNFGMQNQSSILSGRQGLVQNQFPSNLHQANCNAILSSQMQGGSALQGGNRQASSATGYLPIMSSLMKGNNLASTQFEANNGGTPSHHENDSKQNDQISPQSHPNGTQQSVTYQVTAHGMPHMSHKEESAKQNQKEDSIQDIAAQISTLRANHFNNDLIKNAADYQGIAPAIVGQSRSMLLENRTTSIDQHERLSMIAFQQNNHLDHLHQETSQPLPTLNPQAIPPSAGSRQLLLASMNLLDSKYQASRTNLCNSQQNQLANGILRNQSPQRDLVVKELAEEGSNLGSSHSRNQQAISACQDVLAKQKLTQVISHQNKEASDAKDSDEDEGFSNQEKKKRSSGNGTGINTINPSQICSLKIEGRLAQDTSPPALQVKVTQPQQAEVRMQMEPSGSNSTPHAGASSLLFNRLGSALTQVTYPNFQNNQAHNLGAHQELDKNIQKKCEVTKQPLENSASQCHKVQESTRSPLSNEKEQGFTPRDKAATPHQISNKQHQANSYVEYQTKKHQLHQRQNQEDHPEYQEYNQSSEREKYEGGLLSSNANPRAPPQIIAANQCQVSYSDEDNKQNVIGQKHLEMQKFEGNVQPMSKQYQDIQIGPNISTGCGNIQKMPNITLASRSHNQLVRGETSPGSNKAQCAADPSVTNRNPQQSSLYQQMNGIRPPLVTASSGFSWSQPQGNLSQAQYERQVSLNRPQQVREHQERNSIQPTILYPSTTPQGSAHQFYNPSQMNGVQSRPLGVPLAQYGTGFGLPYAGNNLIQHQAQNQTYQLHGPSSSGNYSQNPQQRSGVVPHQYYYGNAHSIATQQTSQAGTQPLKSHSSENYTVIYPSNLSSQQCPTQPNYSQSVNSFQSKFAIQGRSCGHE